ncbi:MAG: hypothetical protein P8100_06785 [bacterium]|jgi:uncharacterized protein YdeI (BOF family)
MNRHSIIRLSTILLTITFLGAASVFEQKLREIPSAEAYSILFTDDTLSFPCYSMGCSQSSVQKRESVIRIRNEEKIVLNGNLMDRKGNQASNLTDFTGDIWITGFPVKQMESP